MSSSIIQAIPALIDSIETKTVIDTPPANRELSK